MKSNNKMSTGAWNNLPHHAVIGEPTKFYVWVNKSNTTYKNNASNWITGIEAFNQYAKLTKLFNKNKKAFINLVNALHLKHTT